MATKPRNVTLVACRKRYAATTTAMKDRRQGRGGARNKVRDYAEGRY
jgi:hypothetical protein